MINKKKKKTLFSHLMVASRNCRIRFWNIINTIWRIGGEGSVFIIRSSNNRIERRDSDAIRSRRLIDKFNRRNV